MIKRRRNERDRFLSRAGLAAILIGTALVPPLSAAESFKARMLTGKSSFEAGQINVRIEVEGWTTAEEVNRLQAAINQGGYNAFESAFKAVKKGTAKFMSPHGLALTIHAAIAAPAGPGRRILLFFIHQPWDAGSTFVSTGRNRFMVMDFTLDEKGGGEGHFYEFAHIRLRPDLGTIEMEAYDSAPKILPIVQETTKKKK
jgi:hypothetical protein